MAEHYGFTPEEVGAMTAEQIETLTSEDEKEAFGKASGTMTIEEYRRFARGK